MPRALLIAVFALLLVPAAGGAYVIREGAVLNAAANGIVLGPDGNFWVAEAGLNRVNRVSPAGQSLGTFPVGSNPTSLAVGPGGRVWVSGTGDKKLYWFDATSPAPTRHEIAVAGTCGPIGIVAGANGRMYFSAPDEGCGLGNWIGWVRDDGSGGVTKQAIGGRAYDLEMAGGKLFVPDFDAGVIRRFGPDLGASAGTFAIGGAPPVDGITADGRGNLWVTLFRDGQNLAYVSATALDGTVPTLLPATGLSMPFGIVLGSDGRLYVAAATAIARVDPATTAVTRYVAPNPRSWQIVNGPDGDLWYTDLLTARLFRYVNSAPRAATGEARATAPTAGSAGGKVDARGNATTVVFDYGTTTAYGATTAPVTVPEGVGEVDVRADLTALAPNTTYHVRVRAANTEGETLGADTTVTTPLPPPAELPASAKYKWRFSSTWTQLTKVVVRRLRAGDTVKLTCKGKGCGVKKKTRQATGAKMKLTRYFGRKHKLRKGVRVRITVTAPNAIGIVSRLDVRKGKDPKISRRCLPPGATTPERCSG